MIRTRKTTRPRKAATRAAPKTYNAHEDALGGRVTFHREDGYVAWVGGDCLGEVADVDEGILVIAEARTLARRLAATA